MYGEKWKSHVKWFIFWQRRLLHTCISRKEKDYYLHDSIYVQRPRQLLGQIFGSSQALGQTSTEVCISPKDRNATYSIETATNVDEHRRLPWKPVKNFTLSWKSFWQITRLCVLTPRSRADTAVASRDQTMHWIVSIHVWINRRRSRQEVGVS